MIPMAHNLDEKIRTKDVALDENVNFDSLFLPSRILKGLTECGFCKPSPIQFKAIPLGRCGFDLIVKSKSGTGKTLVFSTIALETINTSKDVLQVLILVPTREIAVQIQGVIKGIGCFLDGLKVESFIGGLPLEDDLKKAKQCQIAVGAPGRVKHLLSLGALSTKYVRLFILDEADKLMEQSFQNDINEIYNNLPQKKQLIASSATYPHELDTFLANYMLSPTHVSSENETPVLLGLKQFVHIIKANAPNVVQLMKSKNESLLEIFSKVAFTQCLVFSNYQTRAESISNFLNQKGWNSSFISAAQSQAKRLEAVSNLKDFKNRILLSTDLTSRGIDAPNVDLVINYDVPQDAVTYLHRMGRAGRYGSSGICINIAMEGDELIQVQKILGTIGTSNLSMSVLPPLNENNCDLWSINLTTLEKIYGVIPTDASSKFSENIKNEVMSLKQVKQIREKSNKTINNKNKNKSEMEVDVECVKSLLNNKKEEMQEIYDAHPSLDAESLFQSLTHITHANIVNNKVDTDDDCKKRKTEHSLLHALVTGEHNLTDGDDNKKRKRASSNEINTETKSDSDVKFSIFCKNRALLSITKLLCDPSVQVDNDMVNSVEEYCTHLKKEEFNESGYDCVAEILNNTQETISKCKDENVLEDQDSKTGIEDIFKIGYETAVGKQDKTWLDYIPQKELIRFQELCSRDEAVVLSDSEENNDEGEDDYEMEDYQENSESMDADNAHNQDIALQWVPVVQNENSSDQSQQSQNGNFVQSQNENFAKCYEDCSNVLWQNGLTFETVADFDDWFYNWQEQLQSVRNYIQQNIYVEEMSKYQQSRQCK